MSMQEAELRKCERLRHELAGNDLDRKVLAEIAMHEGEAFKSIIALARGALPQQD